MKKEIQHIPSGYKHSPLGPIPEDWEVKRIGDFGKVITGNTPPTEDADNYGNAYKFVSPADISDSKYIEATEKHLSEKGFSISRQMPIGTVLFTCIGSTIGKCAIANETLTSNQQINAIICDTKHSGEFLYYELSHRSNKIKQIAGEQAVPIINKSTFENYKVLCPPFEEQIDIAKILSLWDTAISKQAQLVEKLTLRKRGLMQQLLTGKKRLKGFDGKWKVVKLGEMLRNLSNGLIYDTTTTEGFKITRIETISDGTINMNKVGYCEFEPAKEYKLQKGDILYSHINSISHIGKAAYYDLDDTIYHGMNLLLLRTNELIDSKYLYYLLLSSESKHLVLRYAKPAINQASISTSDIKNFKYRIPRIEEQNAIVSVLANADKEIEMRKQKLASLQEQKKGLMQVLLTGEKRIIKNSVL